MISSARPPWLSRFQRVTSGGAFLPEIDGLRIFAIGLVVLWHLRSAVIETAEGPLSGTRGPLSYVVDEGWFGVQLFFAISGFILALPFAKSHLLGAPAEAEPRRSAAPRPRLGDYYIRRLTRIEPPYVVCLVLLLFVEAASLGVSVTSLLPSFFASVFYVHNIVYDRVSAISGVAWSLEVEVQFYLLAPVFGAIFALRAPLLRRSLFSGLALIAIAAQVVIESRFGSHFRWTGTLPAQLQYFMLGMLLADVYVTDWRSESLSCARWDVAAAGGFCALFIALHRTPLVSRICVLPAIFVIYAAALRGGVFRRFLRAPVTATIGGMCYSIYLLHTTVISLFYPAMGGSGLPASYPARFLVFLVPVALAVIVVAGLFYALVERPCMDRAWPARLWRRLTWGLPGSARTSGESPPPSTRAASSRGP